VVRSNQKAQRSRHYLLLRPENSTVHHILQKVPEDNLFIKRIWNLLVEKKRIKNIEELCECLYKKNHKLNA